MNKISVNQLVLLFSFLLISAFQVNAQSTKFSESIIANFDNRRLNNPQEKIYLQTDKPYYSAGESIWFKGYLVNASTLAPNTNSRFIYVELINDRDSVVSRVKLKKDSLGFDGHLPLKPELPMGSYLLRAYSYWMQNTGNDFFYTKIIQIGNKIDDKIVADIKYGKQKDGFLPVTLSLKDVSKNPVKNTFVDIKQNWSSVTKKRLNMATNQAGEIVWQIPVDEKDTAKKIIDISVKDKNYTNSFKLPKFDNNFDIQFFPESGLLLDNNLQIVAFKAIGSNGLSVAVTGKVYDDKNEEITEFSTMNKGMGKFVIETSPNVNYYAIVQDSKGVEKKVNLPKTQESGVALQISYLKSGILYNILNQTNVPTSSLFLIGHSRSIPFVIHRLKAQSGKISETILPPGITTFSIVDSLGNTYCERLCFVKTDSLPTLSMIADKPVYGKREPVNLSFNLQSFYSKQLSGEFSLSVTDSKTVKQDSLADNIKSYLLLSSDVKGFIEEPAAYFVDNSSATREKLDVLMLTQAWRRFNTPDVIKGLKSKSDYYMEFGQAVSGKVLNVFNKPAKNCNISLFSPYKSTIRVAKTDSAGCFILDGVDFPDSTSIIVRAKKYKSLTDVEIVPDKDVFPNSKVFIPYVASKNDPDKDEYLNQTRQKYYFEGGMRVFNLDELTVTANKKETVAESFYGGMADNEIGVEQLNLNPEWSVLSVLGTIPGVSVNVNSITIRGSSESPLILVDEMEMTDLEEISYLRASDLENIQVFKGANAAIFGARGGNGVIALTLKKGVKFTTPTPISVAEIMPLGYQKPAQFYVPKYEVESILSGTTPDLRTTIYWEPKLKVDASGNILAKFYTADYANDYSVVLEGLTTNGEICRYVGTLKRQ